MDKQRVRKQQKLLPSSKQKIEVVTQVRYSPAAQEVYNQPIDLDEEFEKVKNNFSRQQHQYFPPTANEFTYQHCLFKLAKTYDPKATLQKIYEQTPDPEGLDASTIFGIFERIQLPAQKKNRLCLKFEEYNIKMSQKSRRMFDAEPDPNCEYHYEFCWTVPQTVVNPNHQPKTIYLPPDLPSEDDDC